MGIADIPYADPNYEVNKDFFGNLFKTMGSVSKEVIIALSLIVVFFMIIELIFIKLPRRS